MLCDSQGLQHSDAPLSTAAMWRSVAGGWGLRGALGRVLTHRIGVCCLFIREAAAPTVTGTFEGVFFSIF